jgi:N-acetyl-S-(2-succino)cysteine monooxygenase
LQRQLHLNYFHHPSGCHEAGWRQPEAGVENPLGFEYLLRLARLCEQARLDSIFLGYGYTVPGIGSSDMALLPDPLIALAAVAGATARIGLVATMSTTFNQPYDLAARLSTLDHASHGRAGWNIVTSADDTEARNFGLEQMPEHDDRYRRAAEFVEVCKKLWDSWEPDAVLRDKDAGVWADTGKVHPVGHVGEHYSVAGPGKLPRSPQRYPLLAQAGSSPAGRDFASRYADAMFTIAPTLEAGREFYAEMKQRVAAHGRDPDAFVIMPGLAWVLGDTETEARRRADALVAGFVVPEGGLGLLSAFLKIDLNVHPLDGPVPELPPLDNLRGGIHRMRILYDYVAREEPTIRQLAGWFANQMRGHGMFVGTAEQLADRMQEWFETGACDGYLLLPPVVPRDLEDFCRDVVPILQERGLFRTEYEGTTLREHYGVPLRDSAVLA